jgi:hypothetical protein
MTSKVYIGTAGTGTLQLDDGRTIKLNGFGGLAQVSDGTELFISGTGYLAVPDMTTTQLVLNPASGTSGGTTAQITVSGQNSEAALPTGTMTVFINGTEYTSQPLVNGSASTFIPGTAFNDGPGTYTIRVSYSGDANYSGSTATETYTLEPA